MRRALVLFVVLWAVGAGALAAQGWYSMTPWQRYYWRSEAEAELLVHVHVPSLNFAQPAREPAVAVVLWNGRSWGWAVLPATEVRRDLVAVFPVPVLSGCPRAAAIAAVEAVVLYAIVLGLARVIAAKSSTKGSASPATGGR